MTTNYTATVEITTPSAVLTDFTAVVPAALGVNVFGAATDADINTFDIGPTGDSNILLQTLAAGNHHVHDGVCHNSADGTVPPYGVHGIYDKANGTLVEQMEFHHHPNGQGYSPRYANACYQSVFHDTPFSIGLFNYQGAAVGAGGSLRIRDCVFYNVPSGGYVFYSDGLWLESNGALLGDSLISVEIDHCTIDIRGVTNPFDFSQCHNDVYLTNCVIISDSGLPLSSIITPPLDSSVVHLDGSIVLDSADAATYLGPAPTFTPIAVGGSPVIGTAVASPPATFAQWGNEGDLGATQTGSSPPGPPPLPGPGIPALDIFVCGQAGDTGVDTLVIPITVDVPPTTQDGGATFVFVFYQWEGSHAITDMEDDAPVDNAYSLCVFVDGLNHYNPSTQPAAGLIVNPLVGGVNSITLNLDSTVVQIEAVAIAVTGISLVTSVSTGTGLDPSLTWWPGALIQFAEAPTGAPTSTSQGAGWDYGGGGTVTFIEPAAATDADWDYQSGVLALFWIFGFSETDQDGWAWAGAITDFFQYDVAGIPSIFAFALGTADITPGAAVTTVAGVFGDGTWPNGGNSIALRSGAGPTCTTPPPPGGGVPIFNNHIRLSE